VPLLPLLLLLPVPDCELLPAPLLESRPAPEGSLMLFVLRFVELDLLEPLRFISAPAGSFTLRSLAR
jgi:hypothetical protein